MRIATRINIIVGGTALAAIIWVAIRAHVQAITIDEADTYLFWVGRPDAVYWSGGANNHVLNSLLIRLLTSIFGLSHLTVRGPALFGAVLYVGSAFALCTALFRPPILRWSIFVCMVYNPFVMDYLVAARGYGLAAAFLLVAVTTPCLYELYPTVRARISLAAVCCVCSIALALSFAGNFSFAVVDALTLAGVCLWANAAAARHQKVKTSVRIRFLAATLLPGLLVTLFLCGSVLNDWRHVELIYGARSFREMWKSLGSATLYELNTDIVNPLLLPFLYRLHLLLIPRGLGIAVGVSLLVMVAQRRLLPKEEYVYLMQLGLSLAAITTLTVFIHWMAFRILHVLMPLERTALYLAPLTALIVGCVAAMPLRTRAGQACRGVLQAVVFGVAVLFLLCMRLNYFKEWKFDADVKGVHDVLVRYSQEYGIEGVPVNWRYLSSFKFYDRMANTSISADDDTRKSCPPGKLAYVLYYPDEERFIQAQHLKVIYRGKFSDIVIAVDASVPGETK